MSANLNNNIPIYGSNADGKKLGDWTDILDNVYVKRVWSGSVAHNASDIVVVPDPGATEALILGCCVSTSNHSSDSDVVATVKYDTAAAAASTAGVDSKAFGGPGNLPNTKTVKIDASGSAGTCDVSVYVLCAVNVV